MARSRGAFVLLSLAIAGGCASSSESPSEVGGAGATGSPTGMPGGTGGNGGESVAGSAGAGIVGPGSSDGGPSGAFGDGVDVHLTRNFDAPKTISFGLPVPPHAVSDASTVRVSADGKIVPATIKAILREHDPMGAAAGVRSLLIQLPATVLTGMELDVHVAWKGTGDAPASNTVPYATAGVSIDSPATADTAVRSITQSGGTNQLVETMKTKRTLFPAREPMVLATYPSGYLAQTGILGPLVGQQALKDPNLGGVAYLGTDLSDFAASAMYAEKFALNPDSISDPLTNFEGWLYDRCATYLTAYAHTDDARFLRHALKSCAWYVSKINLTDPNRGIFLGQDRSRHEVLAPARGLRVLRHHRRRGRARGGHRHGRDVAGRHLVRRSIPAGSLARRGQAMDRTPSRNQHGGPLFRASFDW